MKYVSRAAAAALVAVVVTAPVAGSSEIIEQVLVKVNGDIITKSDLETRQINALRQQTISRRCRTTRNSGKRWPRSRRRSSST